MKESTGALVWIAVIIAIVLSIGLTIRNIKQELNDPSLDNTIPLKIDGKSSSKNAMTQMETEKNNALRESRKQLSDSQRQQREAERQLRDAQRQLRSN